MRYRRTIPAPIPPTQSATRRRAKTLTNNRKRCSLFAAALLKVASPNARGDRIRTTGRSETKRSERKAITPADGPVHVVSEDIRPETVAALCTMAAGEVVSLD